MAYARGNFGIEYDTHRRNDGEGALLKWVLAGVAILGVISFVTIRGCLARMHIRNIVPAPAPANVPPPPPRPYIPVQVESSSARPKTEVVTARTTLPAPAQLVRRWLTETGDKRSARDRMLLERLFEAERTENVRLTRDALIKLRQRPAMADLDEPFARRLGQLNRDWLFSKKPTPWTTDVTVRPGSTYKRIAREHATTLAAVLALNDLPPSTTTDPKPGTHLRVINLQPVALVIHTQTKQADLSLNGTFFRRYYASTSAATKVGSYPITREKGPRVRFAELGIRFAPVDLEEIALLLPPNSSLAITNP